MELFVPFGETAGRRLSLAPHITTILVNAKYRPGRKTVNEKRFRKWIFGFQSPWTWVQGSNISRGFRKEFWGLLLLLVDYLEEENTTTRAWRMETTTRNSLLFTEIRFYRNLGRELSRRRCCCAVLQIDNIDNKLTLSIHVGCPCQS